MSLAKFTSIKLTLISNMLTKKNSKHFTVKFYSGTSRKFKD
jgi:hypothetical protein